MDIRELQPGQRHARAFRNFAEKVAAYAKALHLDPWEAVDWAWKKDGTGAFPGVPSMKLIEDYFNEHLACETCQGMKFIALPLNNLTQHGTRKCPDCKGSGQREFD